MEIIMQATGPGDSALFLGVGISVICFGLFLSVVTDPKWAFLTIAVLLIGFVGVVSGVFTYAQANVKSEEHFSQVVAEHLHIKDPTPLEDNLMIGACREDGVRAVSQYSWINEDGELVEGRVTRSAEQNGKCVFTLNAAR